MDLCDWVEKMGEGRLDAGAKLRHGLSERPPGRPHRTRRTRLSILQEVLGKQFSENKNKDSE